MSGCEGHQRLTWQDTDEEDQLRAKLREYEQKILKAEQSKNSRLFLSVDRATSNNEKLRQMQQFRE